MATETALELDLEASGYTSTEPVHFANFPGVWAPGQPIAVGELGFESEDATLALVEELGLPLTVVEVEPGSAPMPERPNHLLSQESQRVLDFEAAANWPPTNHAEADAAAEAAGFHFPTGTRTVAQKVQLLEELRAGAATTDGEELGPPDTEGEA